MTRVVKANTENRIIKVNEDQKSTRVDSVVTLSKSDMPYTITKSNQRAKIVNSKIRGLDVDTSRFRYNQSPDETPDGATTVFTLPNGDNFVTGLLEVFVNGNQKIKDTEWEETGTTQITLLGSLSTSPPESDEVIKFNYIKT